MNVIKFVQNKMYILIKTFYFIVMFNLLKIIQKLQKVFGFLLVLTGIIYLL